MDSDAEIDRVTATLLIAMRRRTITRRLAELEDRLVDVRSARSDWTDEEHDPEGFVLTHAWSRAEGTRQEYEHELSELDAAVGRVDAAGYGICESCVRVIPLGQLERRPGRRLCVACTDAA